MSASNSVAARQEAFVAIQPAEVFDIFGPFRAEGGIERNLPAADTAVDDGRVVCNHDLRITHDMHAHTGIMGQMRHRVHAHPAQHESCFTSLKKVCAASFNPSTIVRYGNNWSARRTARL